MKIAMVGCFGFFLGAFIGGLVGIGVGLAWTSVFQTSCFEGYCGMLVFYSFMPIGILLGGILGALTFGYLGAQDPTDTSRDAS